MKLTFSLKAETKGALRYAQTKDGQPFGIGDGAEVGDFYMRKTAFADGKFPQHLEVTIEVKA